MPESINRLNDSTTYEGPVFIIGMGRSGTKLLRFLLNHHPQIVMPDVEAQFIPYVLNKHGKEVDLSNEKIYKSVVSDIENTHFIRRLNKENKINLADQFGKLKTFEELIKYIYINLGPEKNGLRIIYGEKSPGPMYIDDMELLKKTFPSCKFIHIIRDPRDYALSARKTWNKSILKAAQAWEHTLSLADKNAELIEEKDYIKVNYEKILDDPETTLKRLCDFLGCEFNSNMVNFDDAAEKRGDAKGKTYIDKGNQKKYLNELSPNEIKRIEEITKPSLIREGYELENEVDYKPLSTFEFQLFRVYDTIMTMIFRLSHRGIKLAVQKAFEHFRYVGFKVYNKGTNV